MEKASRSSFLSVLLTAVITLIISAVSTATLTLWLDRPKPVATIASVGFAGSAEYIQLDQELIDLTRESAWIRTLSNFESWSTLSASYEDAQTIAERLAIGISIAKTWKESAEKAPDYAPPQIPRDELLSFPYLVDDIIGSTLVGMAKRAEIPLMPQSTDDLRDLAPVFNLHHDIARERWLVHLGEKAVAFPYEGTLTDPQRRTIEHLARSTSYGLRANLKLYNEAFIQHATNEHFQLQQIIDALTDALYPSTRLYATVNVFNTGRAPIILKPYALAEILNENVTGDFIMAGAPVEPPQGADTELVDELLRRLTQAEGRDVHIEPFLTSADQRQYVLIPPEGQVAIRLETVATLAAAGKELSRIYDTGLLKCRIVFSTIDGGQLQSATAVFGTQVSPEDRDALLVRPDR